jgi:hypothetical protein
MNTKRKVIVNVQRLKPYYSPLVGVKIPPGVSPLPSSLSVQSETRVAEQTVPEVVYAAKRTVTSPPVFSSRFSYSGGASELSLPLTLKPPAPLLGAPRRCGCSKSSRPPPPPSLSQNDGGICTK